MSKITICIAALIPVFIGGCATAPGSRSLPIVASTGADAAKVRFITKRNGGWIDLYPETECNHGITVVQDNTYEAPIDKFFKTMAEAAPKRVDMLSPPAATDRNVAEYAFKAGQVMNIGIGGGTCLGGLSFVAAPSMQYEVVLSLPCTLTVNQLEAEDGAVRRRPVKDLRPLVCERAFK